MQTLVEKIKELSFGAFDYLRFRKAQYIIEENSLTLIVAYPEARKKEAEAGAGVLATFAKRALGGDVDTVEIKLVASHFDRDFFLSDLFEYIKRFPVLSSVLTSGDVDTDFRDGVISVAIAVDETVWDYCEKKGFLGEVGTFLRNFYCETVDVKFFPKPSDDDSYAVESYGESHFSARNLKFLRTIRPQNVEALIGAPIYDKARYIVDVECEADNMVLCGTIEALTERMTKAEQNKASKKYYRFTLRDYTGEISCLYFPNQKTANRAAFLKDGKSVVVYGKTSRDLRTPDKFTMIAKYISFCTLPETFAATKVRLTPDEAYRFVFPEKYTRGVQTDVFGTQDSLPKFLEGKTFCVFDLETTGLSPKSDRIIEIGAVKIENGVITETFSSFVDPKMPLPENIVALTGIRDSDLIGKHTIDEVLPDFFKFSFGSIFVGHNVSFDCGFVSESGFNLNIFFENETVDTMTLAKRYLPELGRYKLSDLTKHFSVTNVSAHRAIYDALATAEVFIRLAKYIA